MRFFFTELLRISKKSSTFAAEISEYSPKYAINYDFQSQFVPSETHFR